MFCTDALDVGEIVTVFDRLEGSSVYFQCPICSHHALTMTWLYMNNAIDTTQNRPPLILVERNIFLISNVTSLHYGVYTCVVDDNGTTFQASFLLNHTPTNLLNLTPTGMLFIEYMIKQTTLLEMYLFSRC